jgi:hypothetical protein
MNGWYPRPPARSGWYVGVGEDDNNGDTTDRWRQAATGLGLTTTPVEALPTRVRQTLPPVDVPPPTPPERVPAEAPLPQTEEDLQSRLAQYQINPIQRLGQLGRGIQENWLTGGVGALAATLEPLVTTPMHYAAGALEGANQWATEHYVPQIANMMPSAAARNAIANELSGNAQTENQEGIGGIARRGLGLIGIALGAAIPSLALMGAAKVGADIATGNVPEAPAWTQTPEGTNTNILGERGWVPPARNLGEIVDPTTAIARFHGNAPGWVANALDLVAMAKASPTMGLGKVAGLNLTPSEMVVGGLTKAGEWLQPEWNVVKPVEASPITRALNRVGDVLGGQYTVPATTFLGGAAGAIKGGIDTQNVQDPVEAAKTIGLDTFAGATLGFFGGVGLARAGGGMSQMARLPASVTEGRIDFSNSPLNKVVEDQEIAARTAVNDTGTTEEFLYPGGTNRQLLASVRSMFTDRYAFIEDWQAWAAAKGIQLPADPVSGYAAALGGRRQGGLRRSQPDGRDPEYRRGEQGQPE